MKLSDFDDDYIERLRERFWAKVERRGPDDCWEWTGARNNRGYGNFGLTLPSGGYTVVTAHRASIMLRDGFIEDEKHGCHTCDNTSCVNPSHLFVGTSRENARDMVKKGRCKNPPGEGAPSAKLTRKEVVVIKKLIKKGVARKKIAARYCVTVGTVGHIARGHTWSHIG